MFYVLLSGGSFFVYISTMTKLHKTLSTHVIDCTFNLFTCEWWLRVFCAYLSEHQKLIPRRGGFIWFFFRVQVWRDGFFFIFLVPVNGRKLPSGRGGVKSFLPRCPKSIRGNRASLCPSSAAAAGHQIFGCCFFGQTNTVAQLALSLQKSSRTRVAVYNPFLIWEVKWTSEGCPSFNLTQAPPHHNS